jgi:hypothetical protein
LLHHSLNHHQTMENTVTKKEIQEFIASNDYYITAKKIMRKFGVSHQKASSNINAFRKKKSSNNENSAKFHNENGNGKQQARMKMIKYIDRSNLRTGKILTLPFSKCIIEKELMSVVGKNNFEFIGYERDKETYWDMMKTILNDRLPIYPVLGDIGEEIQSSYEDKYSHLILDYCCQLNTIAEDMISLFSGNIMKVGGMALITLNKRICKVGNADKIYNEMNQLVKKEKDTDLDTIHAMKVFFSKVCGFNYSIEEFFEYHDTASMVLIIIKRIR